MWYELLEKGMDKKLEKKWENISELLSQVGSNLNILEEEVDIKVQKEYFNLAKMLSTNASKYQILCTQYLEQINDLYDETLPLDKKKEMLVILATLDDVSVYRAIESFSKSDGPLQKWAIIALQQSRMLIQSGLLDDPGIFISTGLGGQGSLLRYFCVFLHRTDEKLEDFQQRIVRDEIETALSPLKGIIEQIDFFESYSTSILLLPLNTDLKKTFETIITECNLYGNFLHENMIITNVKKLSEQEILTILHKKD